MKKHAGFIIFFAFLMILFLGRLIIMKAGFLGGDYLDQFYPWSKVYADAIKAFDFPFWCRYFHSGFPLMAEGQIGGFYPLNMIMFLVFPFKIAYNYSVILHFVLAGVFTYIYTRRLGAGEWGGALAALLFCFGSAYAGCFYNIVTLKTLAWFPLVLYLMDRFTDSKRPVYIVACGIIAGIQCLAGFLQMAAYSFALYIIYFLYSLRLKKVKLTARVWSIALFVILCAGIALPQALLTYGLAQSSARSSATLGFALWGSFLPPSALCLFFPKWLGFLGVYPYIGIFSLLFLIYGLMHTKDSTQIRPLILLGVIAFLCALGKYNPLYVFLLKIGGFYGFRNPSKFLFFTIFAISVLSGFGFSRFFRQPDTKRVKTAAGTFITISTAALVIFFVSKAFLTMFKDKIIYWIQSYASQNVWGKPYHRYSLDTYMEKAKNIYQALARGTQLSDIYILCSVLLTITAIACGIYIYKRAGKVNFLRVPVFCIIFIDIFIHSFYGIGFRGNIVAFDSLKPGHPRTLNILKSDKTFFRFLPFDLSAEGLPYWPRPNANILPGLDSVAAYSPLVEKAYKDKFSGLEAVDDSLGLLSPKDNALAERYQLLKLLNVKYIITTRDLDHRFLKKIIKEDGVFLYELKGYLPRVFFITDLKNPLREEAAGSLELKEYRSGFAEIDIFTEKKGYLVFSENYYPGWAVYVNGQEKDIVLVEDIVQAVKLGKGRHTVVFRYKPNKI